MLYHNIIGLPFWPETHVIHHHHGGVPHPSSSVSPSLIRLSAPQRLAVAGVLIGLIWAAFFWATR
jgi:hypothetical protein